MCFSKTVASASTDEVTLDTAFLGAVTADKDAWQVTITMEGENTEFKLDTGAEITAISTATYQVCHEPLLERSSRPVFGPTCQKLTVIGQTCVNMEYRGVTTKQTVYVIEGLKSNLLGLPAIQELNILQ